MHHGQKLKQVNKQSSPSHESKSVAEHFSFLSFYLLIYGLATPEALSLKCYVCSSSTTNEECNKNTQECQAPVDMCMTVVDTLGTVTPATHECTYDLNGPNGNETLNHKFPGVFFLLVSRLCQVHSEAMRQPRHLQQRLLVRGRQRRRQHHQLLQHSRSVQFQRSKVHSHAHVPAAVDRRGVTSAVALKVVAIDTLSGCVTNLGFEHVVIYLYVQERPIKSYLLIRCWHIKTRKTHLQF